MKAADRLRGLKEYGFTKLSMEEVNNVSHDIDKVIMVIDKLNAAIIKHCISECEKDSNFDCSKNCSLGRL